MSSLARLVRVECSVWLGICFIGIIFLFINGCSILRQHWRFVYEFSTNIVAVVDGLAIRSASLPVLAMANIPNVLATRYASEALTAIWSPEGRVIIERQLWVAVLRAQRDLGLAIPEGAIEAYESVIDKVDLASISSRERVTRHDVKARIEEFCELAGHEHIHKGMTSRDLTENVEQLQTLRSLEIIRLKAVASLIRLARRAAEWRDVTLTGRTHNVAAQLTTVGKRLAMFGDEMLGSFERLDAILRNYAARGIKGAVGTQLDQLSLFDGNASTLQKLEAAIAGHLGIDRTLDAVGQVYPRSLDHAIVGALFDICSAPSSFATTLRLMSGHELASEGFAPGQVGSSAMPHKINCRSCERLNGFHVILSGYLTMTSALAGSQWNEGDVSCSVVRRVALPDAFFAADGLFETFLTILDQMTISHGMLERENDWYRPFLLTTAVLMAAVKAGAGRETAHEAIKEHSVATIADLHSGKIATNDLFGRLADDPRLGLSAQQLSAIAESSATAIGTAGSQVDRFVRRVEPLSRRFPDAAKLVPAPIV